MDKELVTITKEEYEELLKDQRILTALYNNGVDNWEWYGEAIDSIEE